MGKLSALKAKAINKPGMHGDGDGLYLQVRSATQRSWVFRYKRHNRSHMLGLGAFPDVALSEARERAAAARKVLRDGLDPLTRRAEQRAGAQTVAITFVTRLLNTWTHTGQDGSRRRPRDSGQHRLNSTPHSS